MKSVIVEDLIAGSKHMNLNFIPLLIHRVLCYVGSPFTAVMASAPLGKRSIKFSTFMGIILPEVRLRSDADVGRDGLANSFERCSFMLQQEGIILKLLPQSLLKH
ncbi:hypothetical protein CHARACLAT_032657 [Characodon lateralis]|uniref:Uncharacterized protein n=1 Tax=Characodon lateralis TaxID=208331 RepID=A0ABU7DBZ0_9TELE|nr:hypothetical protein [Characodon lateralis]